MHFSEEVWQRTQPVYDAIVAHPFNRELAAGTLARARFTYYVQQDSLYLRDYMRALTLLGAKAEALDEAQELLTCATDAIQVERDLHQMMSQTLSIPPARGQEPACFAYTQFLLAATALESYAVGLAAILPCFWIYRDVGLDIAGRAAAENPYQPWIDTYSDVGFQAVTDRMIAMMDRAAAAAGAAERERMAAAFVRSAQCEWAFWDAAYAEARWPV